MLYAKTTHTIDGLAVLSGSSPNEFELDDPVPLKATIIDASTGNKFTGYDVTVEFFNVASDNTTLSLGTNHSDSGIILKNNVFYPHDGLAYAYMAKILPAYQGSKVIQGIASNPVQLTVSEDTTMLLEVTRDNSTLKHTVVGKLLNGTTPVIGKYVHLNINDTESLPAPQTNSSGYFSREFDFQPENNQNTTYIITATFEGDTPVNATAWAYTLDGQQYPACRTIQYGYKPSSNMTLLTVDPAVTQLLRAENWPEDMQKETEKNGWFTIWHEWSWWYPWYRMHVKIHINPTIDVGFSPILPGGETQQWFGLEAFAEVVQGFIEELTIDVGMIFLEYVLAKVLSFVPFAWFAAAAALGVKAFTQVMLLVRGWSDRTKMLATALVNFIMGLIATEANVGAAFINALFNIIYGGTMSVLYLLRDKLIAIAGPIQHIRTWLDGVEIAMDFSLGAAAYARFMGRI